VTAASRRVSVGGLSIPLEAVDAAPATEHLAHQNHCRMGQCGACWRCRQAPAPVSTPVVPAWSDQVVQPRWMDGSWGGPIPQAAYQDRCHRCGAMMTVQGQPSFDADGSADIATQCLTCGIHSGHSWTWDSPDDDEDDEDARVEREYSAAYDAHQERAARLRAGLPAQSEADADLGLTYDLTEDEGADSVAEQNAPVTCPLCRGAGCAACDGGQVPAWAAADALHLSGEATNGRDDGWLTGTTRTGTSGTGWPADVDPVECGCCRMRHGRSMAPGEHCGWCRGGARHRIITGLRRRIPWSDPGRPASDPGPARIPRRRGPGHRRASNPAPPARPNQSPGR
jgi:hypothetical protein